MNIVVEYLQNETFPKDKIKDLKLKYRIFGYNLPVTKGKLYL